MTRYRKPRNQRLPSEAYCDPTRVTFFTVRATFDSSPFADVTRQNDQPIVRFDGALCDVVVFVLRESREKDCSDVLVYCLMPDHLHFFARPRVERISVLTMVDRFKSRSTNRSWDVGHRGRLWQPRSFDHVIRRDESLHEKAEYILNNPVRKGYVRRWQDWPYSGVWNARW